MEENEGFLDETTGQESDTPEEGTEEQLDNEQIEPEQDETAETHQKMIPEAAYMAEKRKRQELEARLKEKETATVAVAPTQPKTIEEFYEADPKGTVEWINGEITRLVNDDPYGNAAEIERLRDVKIDLREHGKNSQAAKAQRFVTALTTAIPDFDKRREDLTSFAIGELGYSQEDLATLTNPSVVGERAAVNTVKLINKQFEASKATKTVKTKQSQPAPASVQDAGEGVPQQSQGQVSLQKLWDKAQSTGDYTDYFKARGII